MDFLDLVKEYGIVTALAVAMHIPTYSYLWRHRKNIEAVPEIVEKLENVHNGCKIDPKSVKKLEDEVHLLKTVDTKMEEKIGSMEKYLDKMDKKLDTLIDLHLKG